MNYVSYHSGIMKRLKKERKHQFQKFIVDQALIVKTITGYRQKMDLEIGYWL